MKWYSGVLEYYYSDGMLCEGMTKEKGRWCKANDVADLAGHIIDYLKPLIKDFNDRCDGRCFPKVLPDWAQVKYDKGTALIAELEEIAANKRGERNERDKV